MTWESIFRGKKVIFICFEIVRSKNCVVKKNALDGLLQALKGNQVKCAWWLASSIERKAGKAPLMACFKH